MVELTAAVVLFVLLRPEREYNANPASLTAALQVLAAGSGPAWLVLGDMAELGENTGEFHRQAGIQARAEGIERIYCIGQYAELTAKAFGEGGRCFPTMDLLLRTLRDDLQASSRPAPTILVKGSRSMRMERVIQTLSAVH
jgi:UDP-N-acetylmuramoyl-tripeptide--D-alanyl-D-alanine ligase